MKTLLLSLLLVTIVSAAIQPSEEKIIKYDKAQVASLREEQRSKLEGLGARKCGEYFLSINEKEVAYTVKSGKSVSVRISDLESTGVEIDNKLKSPLAKMATGTDAQKLILRLSQKDYDNAKGCLPKLK